jgi:hypothetical protein
LQAPELVLVVPRLFCLQINFAAYLSILRSLASRARHSAPALSKLLEETEASGAGDGRDQEPS